MSGRLTKLKVIGSLLIFFGVSAISLKLTTNDTPSIVLGLGGGLVGMGIALIFFGDKQLVRSQSDEREVMIREKAGQVTNGITFFLLAILTSVFIIMKVDSWIIIAVAFVALLQILLFRAFRHLFESKF